MGLENEPKIIYSASHVAAIRKADPNLSAMTQQWEQMFQGQVQVSMEGDRLVVSPRVSEHLRKNLEELGITYGEYLLALKKHENKRIS